MQHKQENNTIELQCISNFKNLKANMEDKLYSVDEHQILVRHQLLRKLGKLLRYLSLVFGKINTSKIQNMGNLPSRSQHHNITGKINAGVQNTTLRPTKSNVTTTLLRRARSASSISCCFFRKNSFS